MQLAATAAGVSCTLCASSTGRTARIAGIRSTRNSTPQRCRVANRSSVCCCSRPYSNNALDTTLAWGDILTLTATEVSSDRVPVSELGMLCSVLVLAWVGTAMAKGDYCYKAASNQILFGAHQINMCLAAFNCTITWAMFAPVALAGYASLISHGYMPSQPFAPGTHPGELPAQLEVLVSAMFTVAAWRGIYAGLRPYI